MRWTFMVVIAGMMACTPEPTPVDTDTNQDTDSGDTDTAVPIQWVDRTIETSTTLTGVYSGGNGAWIVGEGGRSWRLSGGRAELVETSTDADLLGVWGRGDGSGLNLTAVGYAGTVLDLVADEWVKSEDSALGTVNFEDVDGTASALTAVSATGIYTYDGTTWSFEDGATSLRAVHVTSSGVAWAVGDRGAVLRRDGGTWTAVTGTPSGVDLRDVHGNGDDLYVVGNRGAMWRWTGSDFEVIETDTAINLSSVWVAPSGLAYVVGNNGLALRYDPDMAPPEDDSDAEPGGFEEIPTGASSNLYAVYGSGEDNVWAVGNRGAVYRYPGGQ